MLEEAEKSGQIRPGGTVIEGTSGNTAWACIGRGDQGYQCIFTCRTR